MCVCVCVCVCVHMRVCVCVCVCVLQWNLIIEPYLTSFVLQKSVSVIVEVTVIAYEYIYFRCGYAHEYGCRGGHLLECIYTGHLNNNLPYVCGCTCTTTHLAQQKVFLELSTHTRVQ